MEDLSGWTIETGADVPTQDAFAAETQMATLYLLSADGDRLVPVPAEVTMRDGESLAQAALTALLDGAKLGGTDATWPMNGEGKAPTLSVSDGIATVNLPARYRALEPKTLFAVRQAVANTLGSLSGIAYVNVLIGGREEGLDLGATTPVGTLTRIDDLDVQGRYNRLDDQRLSGAGYTRLTTLFFPSADGKMLLPVVRTLAYDAGAAAIDCLYTVLEALGSVSADELIEQHVPEPMGYISEMPEIVRMPETGEQAIEIRFSGELTQALEEQKLTLGVYLGMLTRTLMGVVPGVDGVHVLIDGAAVTGLDAEKTLDGEALAFKNELMQSDDFLSWIGAPVIVYDGAEPERQADPCALPDAGKRTKSDARPAGNADRALERGRGFCGGYSRGIDGSEKCGRQPVGRLCRVAASAGWRRGAREGLFDGQYDDAGAEPAERDLLF